MKKKLYYMSSYKVLSMDPWELTHRNLLGQ